MIASWTSSAAGVKTSFALLVARDWSEAAAFEVVRSPLWMNVCCLLIFGLGAFSTLSSCFVAICAKKLAQRITDPPRTADSPGTSPRSKNEKKAPHKGIVVLIMVVVDPDTERRPRSSSQLQSPAHTRPLYTRGIQGKDSNCVKYCMQSYDVLLSL